MLLILPESSAPGKDHEQDHDHEQEKERLSRRGG